MALLLDRHNIACFYINSNYERGVKLEEIYYNTGHAIIDTSLIDVNFSTENLIGIHGEGGCYKPNHFLLMYTDCCIHVHNDTLYRIDYVFEDPRQFGENRIAYSDNQVYIIDGNRLLVYTANRRTSIHYLPNYMYLINIRVNQYKSALIYYINCDSEFEHYETQDPFVNTTKRDAEIILADNFIYFYDNSGNRYIAIKDTGETIGISNKVFMANAKSIVGNVVLLVGDEYCTNDNKKIDANKYTIIGYSRQVKSARNI